MHFHAFELSILQKTGLQSRISSLCKRLWHGRCSHATVNIMVKAASLRPSQISEYTHVQDTTTRIWDIRQPGKSLAVLSGRMGAVRSLRFSSDGRFLAMAEPADFVHVFDVKAGFHRSDCPCLPGRYCHSNVCAVLVVTVKEVPTQEGGWLMQLQICN